MGNYILLKSLVDGRISSLSCRTSRAVSQWKSQASYHFGNHVVPYESAGVLYPVPLSKKQFRS